MHLGGQGGQRGYAMAAVLVAVAVMGIVMSALLPVWRHQSQREKEAELLFRMQQYALAIDLYRAKNNNQFPPSIDALVQGKYLRKKYKDPMTDDDFQPLFQGQQPGGGRGQGAPQAGGIVGVVSKSKETAIRNQRGATTYNQWQVTAADAPPGPGYPVGARGNRGAGPQSGAPGGQPGGRGNVPPGGRGNPGIGGPGRGTPPFGPVGGPGRGGPGRGGGPGGGPIQVPGGRGGGN